MAQLYPSRTVANQVSKLTKQSSLEEHQNGLRHSYGSYRLAIVKDPAQIAYEMGNTTSMVFKHYRRVVGEIEAQKWFSLYPDVTLKPVFRPGAQPEVKVMSKAA